MMAIAPRLMHISWAPFSKGRFFTLMIDLSYVVLGNEKGTKHVPRILQFYLHLILAAKKSLFLEEKIVPLLQWNISHSMRWCSLEYVPPRC